jgi:hypothetical protein
MLILGEVFGAAMIAYADFLMLASPFGIMRAFENYQ